MNNPLTISLRQDEPEWSELIEPFLAAQDVGEGSKITYAGNLRGSFLPWLTASAITRPRREDILAYKHHLEADGRTAATISSYMSSVRLFFGWLEITGHYPNVARGVKGAKAPRGFRRDALTLNQAITLLASVDRSTLPGLRNYAFLNLMIRTGVRPKEVVWADVGDIAQQDQDTVLWVLGKGHDEKDEYVVLTADTLSPIMQYLTERGSLKPGQPLFCSESRRNHSDRLTTQTIRSVAKRHLRGIGLDTPRLSAHSARHTGITFALKGGASPQETMQMSRHRNIETLMGYAHNLERLESAAERRVDAFMRQESSTANESSATENFSTPSAN